MIFAITVYHDKRTFIQTAKYELKSRGNSKCILLHGLVQYPITNTPSYCHVKQSECYFPGAISISHHIVSPLSQGFFKQAPKDARKKSLFRRAICQSGVSVHPSSVWTPQQSRKFLDRRLQSMGKCSLPPYNTPLPASSLRLVFHLIHIACGLHKRKFLVPGPIPI